MVKNDTSDITKKLIDNPAGGTKKLLSALNQEKNLRESNGIPETAERQGSLYRISVGSGESPGFPSLTASKRSPTRGVRA